MGPQQDPLLLPNPRTSTEGASGVELSGNPPNTSSEGDPTLSSEGEIAPPTPRASQPNPGTIPLSKTARNELGLCRSPRLNKGQYSSTRYINEVFLSTVTTLQDLDEYHTALAYQAELQTNLDTYEIDITDPRVYNAKFAKRGMDPDSPKFNQAVSGQDADKYIEAMKEEITNLKRMNTWILVDTLQKKITNFSIKKNLQKKNRKNTGCP